MRQFGSISKRSLDVLRPQIASEDLFSRGALSQIIENHSDGNSSASGAKIAPQMAGSLPRCCCQTVMPRLYPGGGQAKSNLNLRDVRFSSS